MKKPIIFCLYCVIFTLIFVSFCFAQEEGEEGLPDDYNPAVEDTSDYDASVATGYDASAAAAAAVEAAANAAASEAAAAGFAASASASASAASDSAAAASSSAAPSSAAVYTPPPPPAQSPLPPQPPVRTEAPAPTVTIVFPQAVPPAPPAASAPPIASVPPAAYAPPAPRHAINVIPVMPDPYSNGVYRVQVGAFSNTGLAQRCFNQLRSAGFEPFYEQNNNGPYGVMYRVVLVGVRAADMPWVVQRLEASGFSEVWLREER